MTAYREFLAAKRLVAPAEGLQVDEAQIHPSLFGFQRALVAWALRKGRAAVFADTGLGKTRMQVEWARLTGQRTLILAPLAVAQQTVREAAELGVQVAYARHQGEAPPTGLTITNYERLDRFDPATFGAVVLDESSILKAFSGVTKKALVAAFRGTRFKLCCTATPAPNDVEELCNHADFLGVMSPAEMRSTFFISADRARYQAHYRLKRHAEQAFYRWLASWAMACKRPSDLGFPDDGFLLPPLHVGPVFVETGWAPDGQLFPTGLKGVTERADVRRSTLAERCRMAEAVVMSIVAHPDDQWLIWCGLNAEADRLARDLPGAVQVAGADDPDVKAERLLDFAEGRARILVTKTRVAGYGLNFQRCAHMVFVGLGDSWEQYYQAVRRCWRFGQARPVKAWVVLSEAERPVWDNVQRKQLAADRLSDGLLAGLVEHERAELFAGTSKGDDYEPRRALTVPAWLTQEAS